MSDNENPLKIRLHRADDGKTLELSVNDVRYYQAVRKDQDAATKVMLPAGPELVRESADQVQRSCLGC